MTGLPFIVSNEVEISSEISKGVNAIFNRGLISTQRVSRALKGAPSKQKLIPLISNSKNALRASLSGDMVKTLTGFVDRVKSSGKIYAALYELGDEELIKKLEGLGKRLEIVLSNSVQTDAKTKKKLDGNQNARDRLDKTAGAAWNRTMPANTTELEKRLWVAADELRANSKLKSSEYSVPVLGLIFLRYADHKFTTAKAKLTRPE